MSLVVSRNVICRFDVIACGIIYRSVEGFLIAVSVVKGEKRRVILKEFRKGALQRAGGVE